MKKTVKLNGRLLTPLIEGNKAYISCDKGVLRTSTVVSVKEYNSTFASFETMNSNYEVVLVAETVSVLPMCA